MHVPISGAGIAGLIGAAELGTRVDAGDAGTLPGCHNTRLQSSSGHR